MTQSLCARVYSHNPTSVCWSLSSFTLYTYACFYACLYALQHSTLLRSSDCTHSKTVAIVLFKVIRCHSCCCLLLLLLLCISSGFAGEMHFYNLLSAEVLPSTYRIWRYCAYIVWSAPTTKPTAIPCTTRQGIPPLTLLTGRFVVATSAAEGNLLWSTGSLSFELFAHLFACV